MAENDENTERKSVMTTEITGIIAEFNPFHNGHKYLLDAAEGLKVVIMSGNWMQRGEPAIIDKWTRAEMALKNGADLVVELPFFASVQSADFFATYAVDMLAGLGITQLVFGTDSENADAIDYTSLAQIYREKSEEMADFLDALPDSLTYPQKMQKMWQAFTGIQFDENTPNHILALAYTKAVAPYGIKLASIRRKGAGFHDDSLQRFASASAIRTHLSENLTDVMPDAAAFALAPKVSWHDYFPLLKYKILSQSDSLTDIFQVNVELSVRITAAIRTAKDFESLVDEIATKRYTKARVRRLLTHLLMDVKRDAIFTAPKPHVLGFSKKGQQHLRTQDVVTKVGKDYADTLTLRADSIYQLGNADISEQNYGRRPIIIE
ncbi:nucleotidyltransferase [Pseudolactococcus insecticola]|uniref:tRNA(Met) cytidine acetate ligase n=1 Tax=Pseudolactococcus insecticola TaxID=2709158 RepID=A0A6A0B9C4_9LACT|nr:nucleotidyltransferase [Lactococcus insecticola]GFH40427.1 UPF0348 protein [Lactococcus insecticola]